MRKILAESVHDFLKFTEEGDPIKDMNIGVDNLIKEWLKEHSVVEKHEYHITKNKTINTYNTAVISELYIEELPGYIQFEYVSGGFHINLNRLKTLRGCPKIVTGSFICSWNNLKDLSYSPEEVGEDFIASHNELVSLVGLPKKSKNMSVSNNFLESLKGIPEEINGNFYIHKNPIKTLKYFPKKIKGDLYYTESDVLNKESIKSVCKVEGNLINK